MRSGWIINKRNLVCKEKPGWLKPGKHPFTAFLLLFFQRITWCSQGISFRLLTIYAHIRVLFERVSRFYKICKLKNRSILVVTGINISKTADSTWTEGWVLLLFPSVWKPWRNSILKQYTYTYNIYVSIHLIKCITLLNSHFCLER